MASYNIYINILEHLLAGMAVGMILFPFIIGIMERLSLKEGFILFVPLVTFLCLLYELIGFYFFYQPLGYLSINQYSDTMRDLTLNIVGSVILFVLIIGFKK
ncbi:MAG: hypothetical protein HVN35_08610 [Methanobacteriaceae archaeon]|nr:hypothetical protein [Methanobacteriaceae archaeon]